MEKMREIFEVWADSAGYNLVRIGDIYDDPATGKAWICWQNSWQASRAAIEIKLNISTVGIHGRYIEKDEAIRLLRETGITVKGE